MSPCARLVQISARVEELVGLGIGQPFAPAGRVFKEWVAIREPGRALWHALLREGVAFVSE
jgi:hypothetical protein